MPTIQTALSRKDLEQHQSFKLKITAITGYKIKRNTSDSIFDKNLVITQRLKDCPHRLGRWLALFSTGFSTSKYYFHRQ